MTDHDALAKRAVAAGILIEDHLRPGMYCIPTTDGSFPGVRYEAEVAVKDGRVVLAAMEMCNRLDVRRVDDKHGVWYAHAYVSPGGYGDCWNDSEPIAILTACLDALEAE